MTLEITENELIGKPEARNLATGKSIMAFNIKISDKTVNLNTGHKFAYQNESYEIMNRQPVQSKVNYFKFNCVRKGELMAEGNST